MIAAATRPAPLEEVKTPVASAHVAGLRYVTDQMPGIRREWAELGTSRFE